MQYLKYRSGLLLLFVAFAAVFAAVQLWSGQRGDLVLYTLLLLSAALAGFIFLDVRRIKRKQGALLEIARCLSDYEQAIPLGDGPVEEAYAAVALGLVQRLREQQRAQAAAYRNMCEYYTMWAHQIKTPLFAAELLMKEPVLDRRMMEQEFFELQRYVDMALTYAKSGDIAGDLVLRPCVVDGVLRAAVKKYAGLFIAKNLAVELQPTAFVADTDEKWLAFIVEQALSNAIKYTSAGVVRIYPKGPRTICIADTGAGIRAEDLHRVFEKGYTGYNGRVDKRASGIGLYLSKKLADRLGIYLSVTSGLGQGTVFAMTLPALPEEWRYE